MKTLGPGEKKGRKDAVLTGEGDPDQENSGEAAGGSRFWSGPHGAAADGVHAPDTGGP